MARKCIFTGKRPNVGNSVSHSNRKTKMRQFVNLQPKKLWWDQENRFVSLRLSTRALRTIDKIGLQTFADQQNIDLGQF
jgi:large subunit ribosomal protein L28